MKKTALISSLWIAGVILTIPAFVLGQSNYYWTYLDFDVGVPGLIAEQNPDFWSGVSLRDDTYFVSPPHSLLIVPAGNEEETTNFILSRNVSDCILYFNFKFYYKDQTEVASAGILFRDQESGVGLYLLFDKYYTTYKVRFFEGGDYQDVGLFEIDDWNYFELTYDLNTKEITASLNGGSTIDFISIYEFHDLSKVRFHSNTGNMLWFDNIHLGTEGQYQSPVYPYPPEGFEYLGWEAYYSAHSENYEEPTDLVNSIASTISPVLNNIGGFIIYLADIFDISEAREMATNLGGAIPVARGYLEEINNFLGAGVLPVSQLFLFMITMLVAIFVYKAGMGLIHLIKP